MTHENISALLLSAVQGPSRAKSIQGLSLRFTIMFRKDWGGKSEFIYFLNMCILATLLFSWIGLLAFYCRILPKMCLVSLRHTHNRKTNWTISLYTKPIYIYWHFQIQPHWGTYGSCPTSWARTYIISSFYHWQEQGVGWQLQTWNSWQCCLTTLWVLNRS